MSKSYRESGVNLQAGYEVVDRIKPIVRSTMRPGCMGGIGAFGGMFDLGSLNYKNPVLISGTDGVGTKLKLAFALDKHDAIGIDAVAMCVNDILAQGAEPLFFLDYIAVGKNEPRIIEEIVSGVAEGCHQAGCALIGGETAEMPGMYPEGEYDIAGFSVGAVEKSDVIDCSGVKEGDALIALPSSGVHSNGFSLVRRIIEKKHLDLNAVYEALNSSLTLGELLLEPTKIYVKPVLELLKHLKVNGIAHITGGGFFENIPRMLPEGLSAEINLGSWQVPPLFRFLQKEGDVPENEMFNVFNMGVGMVLAIPADKAEEAVEFLQSLGQQSWILGKVTASVNNERVVLK